VVVPASALITFAEVSITVINSAIETDLRSPVALVEEKSPTFPSPPSWGPEQADCRGHDPCTGHPVIIAVVVVVIPVTGRPQVAVAGTKRLLVHGQRRRSKRDSYTHTDL